MTQTLTTKLATSSVVTITPAGAMALLEGNKRNRPISQQHVNKLVRIIEAGRWWVNGDAIKISKTGAVLDGQHRLWACIQAKMPIQICLVEGLEDGVFASLGEQKARTTAQLFSYFEIPRYALAAAIAAGLWYWENERLGSWTNSSGGPAKEELLDVYWRNKNEIDASGTPAESLGKLLEGRIGGVLWIMFGRKNSEFRDLFFERLRSGASLSERMAVYLLRRRLEANALSTVHKLPTDYKAKLTIKAWNFREQPVKTLKMDPDEPFPEVL